MPRSRTVVLSDIHIGNGYRTCWYQPAVHEPYLVAALEHVIRIKDDVAQLVILGDLFDFWTYPPEQAPPSVAEILAANPGIFGSNGKLVEAVDALEGRVTYMRGNHDINITQDDLNQIPGAHKILLAPDLHGVAGVTFAHGHHYTLFNAPPAHDPGDPTKPPCGHYVTRAVSDMVERLLSQPGNEGKTIADLPDWGVGEVGFLEVIETLGNAILQGDLTSVYPAFIDFIVAKTGMDPQKEIKLLGGRTSTLQQSKATYANLATEWVESHGGGWNGKLSAYKAIWADKDGSYMGWFAETVRRQTAADLVVMGHTHFPKLGLVAKPGGAVVGVSLNQGIGGYMNTGYLCPAKPDFEGARAVFTFGEIDHANSNTPSMWQVARSGDQYTIASFNAPPDWVVYTGDDYSTYVEIVNNTPGDLQIIVGSQEASYGYYVVPPPGTITPGRSGFCWVQDYALATGGLGAEGTVTYLRQHNAQPVKLEFGCPYVTSNYASGADYYSAVGTSQVRHNAIDSTGKPVFVKFVVG